MSFAKSCLSRNPALPPMCSPGSALLVGGLPGAAQLWAVGSESEKNVKMLLTMHGTGIVQSFDVKNGVVTATQGPEAFRNATAETAAFLIQAGAQPPTDRETATPPVYCVQPAKHIDSTTSIKPPPHPKPRAVQLASPPPTFMPPMMPARMICGTHHPYSRAEAFECNAVSALLLKYWPLTVGFPPVDVHRLVNLESVDERTSIVSPNQDANPLHTHITLMLFGLMHNPPTVLL